MISSKTRTKTVLDAVIRPLLLIYRPFCPVEFTYAFSEGKIPAHSAGARTNAAGAWITLCAAGIPANWQGDIHNQLGQKTKSQDNDSEPIWRVDSIASGEVSAGSGADDDAE